MPMRVRQVSAFCLLCFMGALAPLQAENSGAGVLERMVELCGKAFQGQVLKGAEDDPWRQAKLIIHVQACTDTQVKIPLHFNDDRSRTWIIKRLDDGRLSLKHDHRHADGSLDAVTNYGGISIEGDGSAGDKNVAFPADAESKAMFEKAGLTASVDNVWHLSLNGDMLVYRLTRPDGRDFQVGFDLTRPVAAPPPSWALQPEKEKH